VDSNPTADDLDWLRRLKAGPRPIPANIAARLGTFGLAKPGGPGAFAITSKGHDALLEQDMRDAEDR